MAVLEVRDLVKRYRSGTLANDGISVALEPGEIYGLLGPNGAGKTTLVRQVLGLLRPTSGSIAVNGVDVVANPGYARSHIGFLPQAQFTMDSLHVDEFIYGVARLRGLDRAAAHRHTENLVERLDLGEFRKTAMMEASGGIRRMAGFATAIVGGARVLVLDEPTNDVDPVRRQCLWDIVDELGQDGVTVLLVTHNLAEAERVIDRFAIIDQGRILREGTPAALRSVVTDRLRLELTANGPVSPHAALTEEAGNVFLFDERDLGVVCEWLARLREDGRLADFRIGPPSLDDIYHAVATRRQPAEAVA
ncbi:MAG TPA: ABC transporter ATP-binding protein [Tepidiformaceae bacterium]|nr:ABC transporter ATP-binding protein [Tepidiformaceae bacterium]